MENKNDPLFKKQDIPLEKMVKVKFNSNDAIAKGESSFGSWFLFPVFVEDSKVHEGRGKDEKIRENYTGDAVMFLSQYDVDTITKKTDTLFGSEWLLRKTAKENNENKIIRVFEWKLIDSDTKKDNNTISKTNKILSDKEKELLKDAQELIDEGHVITEELFLIASKEPQYGNNISEERAKILFKMLKVK